MNKLQIAHVHGLHPYYYHTNKDPAWKQVLILAWQPISIPFTQVWAMIYN